MTASTFGCSKSRAKRNIEIYEIAALAGSASGENNLAELGCSRPGTTHRKELECPAAPAQRFCSATSARVLRFILMGTIRADCIGLQAADALSVEARRIRSRQRSACRSRSSRRRCAKAASYITAGNAVCRSNLRRTMRARRSGRWLRRWCGERRGAYQHGTHPRMVAMHQRH